LIGVFDGKKARHSHDLGLGWWWAWRRRIAAVGRLRLLKLDAALLTVVALVCATTVVSVVVVVVHGGVIRRSRLIGIVWLGVVLVVVLVVVGTSGPTSTIEWRTSCPATATRCEAGA
jgi:uncharacterized membrane protein YhaH (DUF805 family)